MPDSGGLLVYMKTRDMFKRRYLTTLNCKGNHFYEASVYELIKDHGDLFRERVF